MVQKTNGNHVVLITIRILRFARNPKRISYHYGWGVCVWGKNVNLSRPFLVVGYNISNGHVARIDGNTRRIRFSRIIFYAPESNIISPSTRNAMFGHAINENTSGINRVLVTYNGTF